MKCQRSHVDFQHPNIHLPARDQRIPALTIHIFMQITHHILCCHCPSSEKVVSKNIFQKIQNKFTGSSSIFVVRRLQQRNVTRSKQQIFIGPTVERARSDWCCPSNEPYHVPYMEGRPFAISQTGAPINWKNNIKMTSICGHILHKTQKNKLLNKMLVFLRDQQCQFLELKKIIYALKIVTINR